MSIAVPHFAAALSASRLLPRSGARQTSVPDPTTEVEPPQILITPLDCDSWFDQNLDNDRDGSPALLTAGQLQLRVMALMSHNKGASISELIAITKASSVEVRNSIRTIVDDGGEIRVATIGAENTRIFYLMNCSKFTPQNKIYDDAN